jgi:ribose/xylose/arabinose/galactoside ABC-type transport system permease subunit
VANQAPTTRPLKAAVSDLPAVLAWLRSLRRRQSIASTVIALALIWLGLSVASAHFFTVENISNILLQSSPLGLIAGGMTLALIAAEIDLSVGSVVALIGSMVALLTVGYHVPWPLAVAAAMVAGVAVGLVNSWFTTRLGMPSFVATLAMLGIARGGALLLTNGQSIYGLPPGFDFIGQGKVGPVPFPVVIAGAVLAAMHFLLTRTRLGLNIYGVGGNAEAARLAGVDVRHTKVIVLVLSAVMASLAGLIVAARLDAGSGTVGEDLLLDAIAGVVIGGTSLLGGVGRISGTVLGVVLIASIRNGLVLLNVSAFWQQVAIGSIILLAVSLDHLAKGRSLEGS